MLTEQLLTEDIEIDDEPVEQNTAHSLFFDTYYNSLTDIESSNSQLLNAQEQLRWYTSQLDEVDKLADEIHILNSSSISSTNLPRIIKLDLSNDKKSFRSFFKKINQFKEVKSRQEKEISDIEESSKNQLNTLNSKLATITSGIKGLESIIIREESKIKKNTQMFHVAAFIITMISCALNFSTIGIWCLIPGVFAAFIFALIKSDLL